MTGIIQTFIFTYYVNAFDNSDLGISRGYHELGWITRGKLNQSINKLMLHLETRVTEKRA